MTMIFGIYMSVNNLLTELTNPCIKIHRRVTSGGWSD